MSNEQYFYKILQDYGKYLERCEEDCNEVMDLISFASLKYDIGDDDILCEEFVKWTKNHK